MLEATTNIELRLERHMAVLPEFHDLRRPSASLAIGDRLRTTRWRGGVRVPDRPRHAEQQLDLIEGRLGLAQRAAAIEPASDVAQGFSQIILLDVEGLCARRGCAAQQHHVHRMHPLFAFSGFHTHSRAKFEWLPPSLPRAYP